MPLQAIRKRVKGVTVSNVIGFTSAIAKMTVDLTNMSQFPPAALAASVLLIILETIKVCLHFSDILSSLKLSLGDRK